MNDMRFEELVFHVEEYFHRDLTVFRVIVCQHGLLEPGGHFQYEYESNYDTVSVCLLINIYKL